MNRLIISTECPDTVLALLTSYDFIDNISTTTISMPPGRLELPYPDDALSQALGFWFVLAQGCGLISGYRLRQQWEIETNERGARVSKQENQPLPLDDPNYIESLKWANNLLNRFSGDENPYRGVPHWEQTWELLHQMELAHVMSSAVDHVYVLGDIYLGTVDQVAKMSKEDVRRIIDASKLSRLDEITHIADDAGLYD